MDVIAVARLWMLVKPVKRLRNRRRAKKGLRAVSDQEVLMPEKVTMVLPDGSQVQRTEPIIQARSSTKSGAIGLVSLPLLQILQEVMWPWPWFEAMTESAAFAQVVTLAMMYLTARYTKTPAAGGVL